MTRRDYGTLQAATTVAAICRDTSIPKEKARAAIQDVIGDLFVVGDFAATGQRLFRLIEDLGALLALALVDLEQVDPERGAGWLADIAIRAEQADTPGA